HGGVTLAAAEGRTPPGINRFSSAAGAPKCKKIGGGGRAAPRVGGENFLRQKKRRALFFTSTEHPQRAARARRRSGTTPRRWKDLRGDRREWPQRRGRPQQCKRCASLVPRQAEKRAQADAKQAAGHRRQKPDPSVQGAGRNAADEGADIATEAEARAPAHQQS